MLAGLILGKTDARGWDVSEDGCTPEDVAGSALHALGIDHHKEYHTATGRPITLVRDGKIIKPLFS